MEIRIDRSNPLPLYVQLKQSILTNLSISELKPGAQLPSEEDLVDLTGLSRHTVRQALQELEQEGHLKRIQGKGTFVAEPKLSLTVAAQLIGFWEDMTQKGHKVNSQVLRIELIPAPEEVALEMGIRKDSPVVFLERLRTVDGQPFLVDSSYLRADLCPQLETLDLTDQSLYQVLEARYGIRVIRARRTLQTTNAEAWIAKLLGKEACDPVYLLTDLAYIESGELLQLARLLIDGDRCEFVFELSLAPELSRSQLVVLADSTNPNPRR